MLAAIFFYIDVVRNISVDFTDDSCTTRQDPRLSRLKVYTFNLDFSRSGGVGGGVHEAGEEVAGGKGGVDRTGLRAAIPGGPEGAADGG